MDEPTFHPFPRLPYELRVHIWTLTVQPRIVPVSCWIGARRADVLRAGPRRRPPGVPDEGVEASTALRGNLGVPTPANRHARAHDLAHA